MTLKWLDGTNTFNNNIPTYGEAIFNNYGVNLMTLTIPSGITPQTDWRCHQTWQTIMDWRIIVNTIFGE